MPRAYTRNKPPGPVQLDGEKRSRANFRERRRVSELNGMFDVLLNLLPPSHFKTRLSRLQILREAADYITRLVQFLQLPYVHPGEAQSLFPQIFFGERQSNKDSYRRPIKLTKEGTVHAYITRRDLSPVLTPEFIPQLTPEMCPHLTPQHSPETTPELSPTKPRVEETADDDVLIAYY